MQAVEKSAGRSLSDLDGVFGGPATVAPPVPAEDTSDPYEDGGPSQQQPGPPPVGGAAGAAKRSANAVPTAKAQPPAADEFSGLTAGLRDGPSDYTDSALSEYLACQLMPGRWAWCPELGWQEWNGRQWIGRNDADAIEFTRTFLQDLLKDALFALANAHQDRKGQAEIDLLEGVVAALRKYQSRAKGSAVAQYTRGQECVRVHVEDFDADPELLNCGNGVVNLRTGELMPHHPRHMMRRWTPVEYHPGAVHGDWTKSLGAMADAHTLEWLRLLLGSGTTGYTLSEDLVPFMFGDGANGKSTVIGAVKAALGGYAELVMPKVVGGKGSDHEAYIMALRGARLALLEELPQGHVLDMAEIKRVTGTAEITGRRLYRDQETFVASHLLVVTTNYQPRVPDVDHGTWRRLLSVPWPHTFDGNTADRMLRSRVSHGAVQQRAVLAWLVSGALDWLAAGRELPEVPTAVRNETRRWRDDNDVLGAFLTERCEPAAGREVLASDLRAKFNEHNNQGVAWSSEQFAGRMRAHPWVSEHGIEMVRSRAGIYRDKKVVRGLAVVEKWRP